MNVDRRLFRRVALPMYYRAAGLLGPRRPATDVSCGGLRVYLDDPLKTGERLAIELFLPDGDSFSIDVRVAWIRELGGTEARFEAGLEFLAMDDLRREQLERCLDEFG